MSDLRTKVLAMAGEPIGWADVGNLPDVPEPLQQPLRELVLATVALRQMFATRVASGSPREQMLVNAYLEAWTEHLGIADDEKPWWQSNGERFSDAHPLREGAE